MTEWLAWYLSDGIFICTSRFKLHLRPCLKAHWRPIALARIYGLLLINQCMTLVLQAGDVECYQYCTVTMMPLIIDARSKQVHVWHEADLRSRKITQKLTTSSRRRKLTMYHQQKALNLRNEIYILNVGNVDKRRFRCYLSHSQRRRSFPF
jgi:hypothetical protein